MAPADRHGLQKLVLFLAFPITFPCTVAGFLWQFIDFGWTRGIIAFNRFFEQR